MTEISTAPEAADLANLALAGEYDVLQRAKTPDTPENFRAAWQPSAAALIAAAQPFRQALPWPPTATPRVGFFVPTPGMLAHTVNLRTLVRGLAGSGTAIEPYIYTLMLQGPEPAFAASFPAARYGVGVTELDGLLDIRRQAIADHLTAMVFVSTPFRMAFMSAMGVAPLHIWWAHKWHGLELPHLDGYLDACHPFQDRAVIDGREWRCTYTALPELFDVSRAADAAALRLKLPAKIVFGTMCRGEKHTPDHAAVVGAVLSRVPDSIYCYAGRERLPWLEEQLAAFTGRVAYIGWVDTGLWAQVLDVYLDKFPFQSGHTAFQVMAALKPVVWLDDGLYNDEQGVTDILKKTGPGHGVRWATTPAAYVDMAVALANNPLARTAAGAANRAFIDNFMRDEKRMARSVSAAIMDIIAAKKAASPPTPPPV